MPSETREPFESSGPLHFKVALGIPNLDFKFWI